MGTRAALVAVAALVSVAVGVSIAGTAAGDDNGGNMVFPAPVLGGGAAAVRLLRCEGDGDGAAVVSAIEAIAAAVSNRRFRSADTLCADGRRRRSCCRGGQWPALVLPLLTLPLLFEGCPESGAIPGGILTRFCLATFSLLMPNDHTYHKM